MSIDAVGNGVDECRARVVSMPPVDGEMRRSDGYGTLSAIIFGDVLLRQGPEALREDIVTIRTSIASVVDRALRMLVAERQAEDESVDFYRPDEIFAMEAKQRVAAELRRIAIARMVGISDANEIRFLAEVLMVAKLLDGAEVGLKVMVAPKSMTNRDLSARAGESNRASDIERERAARLELLGRENEMPEYKVGHLIRLAQIEEQAGNVDLVISYCERILAMMEDCESYSEDLLSQDFGDIVFNASNTILRLLIAKAEEAGKFPAALLRERAELLSERVQSSDLHPGAAAHLHRKICAIYEELEEWGLALQHANGWQRAEAGFETKGQQGSAAAVKRLRAKVQMPE